MEKERNEIRKIKESKSVSMNYKDEIARERQRKRARRKKGSRD